MAGWGTGSFENEGAVRWLGQLHEIGIEGLTEIFTHATEGPDYLEAPQGSVVIAAAEVVAALKGVPASPMPPEISEWVQNTKQISTPDLGQLAIRAVERVRRNSELKDLWLEAEGLNEWTSNLQELQNRLAG